MAKRKPGRKPRESNSGETKADRPAADVTSVSNHDTTAMLEGLIIPGFPPEAIIEFSQSAAFRGSLEQRLRLALPIIKLMVARKRYRDDIFPQESLAVMTREAYLFCEAFAWNFRGSSTATKISFHVKNVFVNANHLIDQSEDSQAAFRLADALMGIEWLLSDADVMRYEKLKQQSEIAAKLKTIPGREVKAAKTAAKYADLVRRIELDLKGQNRQKPSVNAAIKRLVDAGEIESTIKRAWKARKTK